MPRATNNNINEKKDMELIVRVIKQLPNEPTEFKGKKCILQRFIMRSGRDEFVAKRWLETAEDMREADIDYAANGGLFMMTGYMRQNPWVGKDGTTRYDTDIIFKSLT